MVVLRALAGKPELTGIVAAGQNVLLVEMLLDLLQLRHRPVLDEVAESFVLGVL